METNTMTQVEQLAELVHTAEEKPRKRAVWLGKLNRTVAKATALITANGHEPKRFKRDYANGVASYVCPHCAAAAVVVASEGRGKSETKGDALVLKCSAVNS